MSFSVVFNILHSSGKGRVGGEGLFDIFKNDGNGEGKRVSDENFC